MNILYLASEVTPFAVSGGLADVMGALPKTVKSQLGKDAHVAVMAPLYSTIPDAYRAKMTMVDEFSFMYGWRHAYCGVHKLEADGVDYYFIDNEQYYMRATLYGQGDDAERFAYFCRAVVEFILRQDINYDILHANDWQTALAVIYAKTRFWPCDKIRRMKTVFTIHNIEYQGKFDKYILGNIFDLDERYMPYVEYDGCINLLKGAIVCADLITTVSSSYARELTDPFFAFGLADIIRCNAGKLTGIVNGIDTKAFSPESANDLVCAYSDLTVKEGKANNKTALQKELGLEVNADIPLMVMITRLTHAKGVDLVLHIFEEMMEQNLQFVLLGSGDENYERIFADLCARHPGRAKAIIKFDRSLSKRMYASADLFLMPSKSEPCGLAQMMACGYGTLPIVRRVGGLADTIIPYPYDGANGFSFKNFNAHELLFTIKDALALYQNREEWDKVVLEAMHTDFTWDKSASLYIDTYETLLK